MLLVPKQELDNSIVHVSGQIKAIVTTVLGLYMFDDVIREPLFLIGLIVTCVASGWYSHVKYEQTMAKAREKRIEI